MIENKVIEVARASFKGFSFQACFSHAKILDDRKSDCYEVEALSKFNLRFSELKNVEHFYILSFIFYLFKLYIQGWTKNWRLLDGLLDS